MSVCVWQLTALHITTSAGWTSGLQTMMAEWFTNSNTLIYNNSNLSLSLSLSLSHKHANIRIYSFHPQFNNASSVCVTVSNCISKDRQFAKKVFVGKFIDTPHIDRYWRRQRTRTRLSIISIIQCTQYRNRWLDNYRQTGKLIVPLYRS